ncbi:peptidoglycan editing factor PgeF [Candidatus Accumulibacter phosphatis]|uniref:Purine nucleoside phosphorylase n=1 Tax=Candidatus Accumulibacter phosphatis TaxID=327160 RepID=A0ABX1U1E4_9PROT|nr:MULTISPECIES: peptidoglycan editing factor PgeF [Candidatus Accumulibacter]NMQ29421.1 peptidoglycan editing factor PgeF [Candidatus Accumulibacter phosphatis]
MRSWVSSKGCLFPDWPAPRRVRSLITGRDGGVSLAPYASLNLGAHVGDDALAVAENRRRLADHLPALPCWLEQVHGTTLVDAAGLGVAEVPVADGAFARAPGVVCAVMTADCLPVLLCDQSGSVVAAVHAGWRGLQAGILERAVEALAVPGVRLLAYLGPAIGPQAFEVGEEVRSAFVGAHQEAAAAFLPVSQDWPARNIPAANGPTAQQPARKWLADIYLLARQSLQRAGVDAIYGGGGCTLREAERFFSYRRDGVTGRMAALIWLADA